jgi:hypothetical protein
MTDEERRDLIWTFIERIASEMRAACDQYSSGDIDEEEWVTLAVALWEDAFVALYLFGRGGEGEMGDDDWKELSRLLTEQDKFFDDFALELIGMSDAELANRLGMYASSGQQAFWTATGMAMTEKGMKQERRVLGAAEHCVDCVAYEAEGWKPVGYFPPPGIGSICMYNCHCHMEFR